MKVYTVSDFQGFYPVGFAAIIIAHDEEEAYKLFENAVVTEGLSLIDRFGKPLTYTLIERDLKTPHAEILVNGNY